MYTQSYMIPRLCAGERLLLTFAKVNSFTVLVQCTYIHSLSFDDEVCRGFLCNMNGRGLLCEKDDPGLRPISLWSIGVWIFCIEEQRQGHGGDCLYVVNSISTNQLCETSSLAQKS